MNQSELSLLLQGRQRLTKEEAVQLQRIGRLYSFGAAPLDETQRQQPRRRVTTPSR